MPTTPIYGFPFPAYTNPANIPDDFQAIAEAAETEIARVDDEISGLSALRGYAFSDATFSTSATTATTSGGAVVGTSFVAPPSGAVKVTISGLVRITSTSEATVFLSAVIATGGTVGSGTILHDATSDASLRLRKPDTSGSTQSELMASYVRLPSTTLTPGATYNAYLKHWVTASTGLIGYRRIFVEPW
jgi:hypothetical protein